VPKKVCGDQVLLVLFQTSVIQVNLTVSESDDEYEKGGQVGGLRAETPRVEGEGGKAHAVAIGKIGGYLDRSSDPPPGWQTLWKGLKKVRTWAEGYKLHAESYG